MYKQEVKQKAREKIWKNAIDSLTINREESKILNLKYIEKLWDYSFQDYLIRYGLVDKVNRDILIDWMEFSNKIYQTRIASDLKIIYLCGEEPENDLSVLLKLGVKIENIWAVEMDGSSYKNALTAAKKKFRNLKIFQGAVDDLIKIYRIEFDIIYLDFTKPIFSVSGKQKPLKTIHTIFEEQALSELGVLITNFCEPEEDNSSIDFLVSYFKNQEVVEDVIVDLQDDDGLMSNFTEGPYLHQMETSDLKKIITKNLKSAYSAFCTHYIMAYANIISPSYRILLNKSAKKELFNVNKKYMDEVTNKMGENPISSDSLYSTELSLNAIGYPFWTYLESLSKNRSKLSEAWFNYYNESYRGVSRFDAIKYRDLARYYYLGLKFGSNKMAGELPKINKSVSKTEGVFCDSPLPYLWVELAINQLGAPYHSKTDKHKRFSYKAKEKEMFVDSFVFDKCRSLYDWLPMIDLYGQEFSQLEKQMIVRICLDAIGGKQMGNILPSLYFGSNLIGQGERDWAKFVFGLPKRKRI